MIKTIEELKTEYAAQDNCATDYPFYVQVQELTFIGVIAEEYSPACPFGDSKIKYEHNCEDCKDIDVCLGEDFEREEPERCVHDKRCGYIWIPVEFFLTLKAAREYMSRNTHRHDKLRTYVMPFERKNYEMRGLLKELGFKTSD